MGELPPQENHESGEETPSLDISMSKNTLIVNGKYLEPSDGAEILQDALAQGRGQILTGLERFREYMQELHPDAEVGLAPFSVMGFGMGEARKKVLTRQARMARQQVYDGIDDIKEEYQAFWIAVEASGYIPDVRVHWYGGHYNVSLWAQLPEEKKE
jgi:hypothetical protein